MARNQRRDSLPPLGRGVQTLSWKRVSSSGKDWLGTTLVFYCDLPQADIAAIARSLRHKAELWWYFLDHPEVPQDFNQAERSQRQRCDQALLCVAGLAL